MYLGLSLEYFFKNKKQKAEHELYKINHEEQKIENVNKTKELYVDLKNLYSKILKEQQLIKIAEEKIKLSENILKDEEENYSFGKISLNDYIDAVNKVDQNKFNRITHVILLKKYVLEWLRLTDKLVEKI